MLSSTSANGTLDAALIRGIGWTSIAIGSAQILTWASTLIVVRMLSPDDYGLIALSGIYTGIAAMLSEFGFGAAVVTLRDLSGRQIAQINSVALLFGLLAVAVSMSVAVPLGQFFDAPELPGVIAVASLAFIVTGFRIVPHALLQRDLRFKFLAAVEAAQALTSALCTLVIAALGGGYWALVFGPLASQAAATVLIRIRRPQMFARPHLDTLRRALTFSRHVIVDRLAWYSYTKADALVIGKLLGQTALGAYTFAITFGLLAVEKVTTLVLRVTPSVFSAVQADPVALRRYLLSLTEAVSLVTFPASLGLTLVADDFVLMVLGDKWAASIMPLRVLGVVGALQSISPLLPRVLHAVGDTRFTMRISLLSLIVLPPAFLIGSRWGITGVAVAWLGALPLMQAPLQFRLYQRIGLTLGAYLRSLWPALSASAGMTLVVLAVKNVPLVNGLPPLPHLVLQVAAGAFSYIGIVMVAHGERIRTFRSLLATLRRPAAAPAEAAMARG